jgi:HK97 gp10 family phage protein
MTKEIKRTDEFTITLDREAVANVAAGKSIEETLIILAQVGEAAAKTNAPVDTGHLRRSITHELINGGKRSQHARVGTNVSYAIFQEVGTRFHPAHPFLRPAMAEIESFLRR